ncbi:hypothetical protein NKG05_14700 [Oerskovia sp. M15]
MTTPPAASATTSRSIPPRACASSPPSRRRPRRSSPTAASSTACGDWPGCWATRRSTSARCARPTQRPRRPRRPGSAVVGLPEPWAFVSFAFLMAAAVALTIVHIMTRTSGLRGASARSGALYGWAWFIAFAAMSMLLGGLGRAARAPRSCRSRATRSPA